MCRSGSGSVLGIRIRIQKAPEYGSNTDPDPQHWHYDQLTTDENRVLAKSGFYYIIPVSLFTLLLDHKQYKKFRLMQRWLTSSSLLATAVKTVNTLNKVSTYGELKARRSLVSSTRHGLLLLLPPSHPIRRLLCRLSSSVGVSSWVAEGKCRGHF